MFDGCRLYACNDCTRGLRAIALLPFDLIAFFISRSMWKHRRMRSPSEVTRAWCFNNKLDSLDMLHHQQRQQHTQRWTRKNKFTFTIPLTRFSISETICFRFNLFFFLLKWVEILEQFPFGFLLVFPSRFKPKSINLFLFYLHRHPVSSCWSFT